MLNNLILLDLDEPMNNVEEVQYLPLRGGHTFGHDVYHDLLILLRTKDIILGEIIESLDRLDLLSKVVNQTLLIIESNRGEEFYELLVTFPGVKLIE